MSNTISYSFQALAQSNWADFEQLFGEKGACGGCWCMLWRLPHKAFESGKGTGNRMAMHTLVMKGSSPGLLLYHKNRPIAWCSVSPRQDFIYFQKTRSLQPIDDKPVWAISCLFVDKAYRRQGVSRVLLESVEKHVRTQGGKLLEAYPSIPKKDKMPDAFAWTGLVPLFEHCGFETVAVRGARHIMRKTIANP